MDFKRQEDKRGFRFYQPKDSDNWYPSVTTVKSNTIFDKGLIEWFKRTNKSKIDQKTKHGCNVGDKVHESIEELLLDGKTSISHINDDKERKEASKYLQGFINFTNDYDINVKELEVSMLNSKFGVAGTADYIGELDGPKANGNLSIIDWKTDSTKDLLGYKHQLTCYGTSDPFIDIDVRPDLYTLRLKRRTNKGYQLIPIDYDEKLVKSIMYIFKMKNDVNPKFPEEPETDFNIEDDESESD